MILLSAGHYPKAPGVTYGGLVEHNLATEWINIIALHIRERMAVDIIPTGPLAIFKRDVDGAVVKGANGKPIVIGGKVHVVNEAHGGRRPVALAAELHFNGDAARKQRGSETMYCPGSTRGKQAASIVQGRLGKVMPPDRGIFDGWLKRDRPGVIDYPGDVDGDEHIAAFLELTDPVAIIIEAEFIHNRDVIEAMRDEACQAIALGLVQAAEALKP